MTPQPVGVSNAGVIAVGRAHACAILTDRQVVCWGSNRHGELGDGRLQHGSAACADGFDCSPMPSS